MQHRMRIATEIEEPGFYWYYEWAGGPPELVEVKGAAYLTMTVRFRPPRSDAALKSLYGSFIGPVAAGHGAG